MENKHVLALKHSVTSRTLQCTEALCYLYVTVRSAGLVIGLSYLLFLVGSNVIDLNKSWLPYYNYFHQKYHICYQTRDVIMVYLYNIKKMYYKVTSSSYSRLLIHRILTQFLISIVKVLCKFELTSLVNFEVKEFVQTFNDLWRSTLVLKWKTWRNTIVFILRRITFENIFLTKDVC